MVMNGDCVHLAGPQQKRIRRAGAAEIAVAAAGWWEPCPFAACRVPRLRPAREQRLESGDGPFRFSRHCKRIFRRTRAEKRARRDEWSVRGDEDGEAVTNGAPRGTK